MEKEEIVRSYKQALNKTEQVIILSELTLLDIDTIVKILKDAGVVDPSDLRKRICCRCGREHISLCRKGIAVCPECQGYQREITKLEYQIKRNNAKIAENNRNNGRIMVTNARLRERLKEIEAVYKSHKG